MNFLEAAQKLISIESSPDIGTSQAVDYLKTIVEKEPGLSFEVLPSKNFGPDQCNFLVQLDSKQTDAPGLLLLSHLDTTDPGSYGLWTKTNGNPFSAKIYGDELYGLGVTSKLDFLCKLESLTKMRGKSLSKPLYLLGTHGEESGLLGAREFLTETSLEFSGAIVGHPTNLSLVHQGLGISVVEIDIPFSQEELEFQEGHNLADNSFTQSKMFRGKGAHSAAPHQGESAIEKMFEFLLNMPSVVTMKMNGGIIHNTVPEHASLEFVMSGSLANNISDKLLSIYEELNVLRGHFKKYPMEGFDSQYSTLNIGKIRSSNFGITLTGSCRLLPSVPEKEYRSWLLSLKQFCERNDSKLQLKRHIPSFKQNLKSDWLLELSEVIESVGIADQVIKSSSMCTEANLIRKKDIECVLFGAGIGPGNSHQPNEFIKISDLKKSVDFYDKTLERMCL